MKNTIIIIVLLLISFFSGWYLHQPDKIVHTITIPGMTEYVYDTIEKPVPVTEIVDNYYPIPPDTIIDSLAYISLLSKYNNLLRDYTTERRYAETVEDSAININISTIVKLNKQQSIITGYKLKPREVIIESPREHYLIPYAILGRELGAGIQYSMKNKWTVGFVGIDGNVYLTAGYRYTPNR